MQNTLLQFSLQAKVPNQEGQGGTSVLDQVITVALKVSGLGC